MTLRHDPEESQTLSAAYLDEYESPDSGIHFAIMMDCFQTLVRLGNDD